MHEQSSLCEIADRFEDALAAARRSLTLRPWYRPGVQATAHLLVHLNRDQEALELLVEATQRIESGDLWVQLARLQTELGNFSEASAALERALPCYPLMEKRLADWFAVERADAAYNCGQYERAAELLKPISTGFHAEVAKNLAVAKPDAIRVQIPVQFVRQHHLTCAPATLSTISQFWSLPADHLEVAEQICYDGTPAHSERGWAEKNGCLTREFRVTWEIAVALLDRGIPFTLTTVEPGNAHLQAVIGYDQRRGTLLIRDPGMRYSTELIGVQGLKHYRSTGPRGMVFVPNDRAALLEGLDLPEAEIYDEFYGVQGLLAEHKRVEAGERLACMERCYPDHRLTFMARRAVSSYDADVQGVLSAVEKLLLRFPSDVNLQLSRLSCLRELARRPERLAWLAELNAKGDADSLIRQQYALELTDDAREHNRVRSLGRLLLRMRPLDGAIYHLLAGVLWDAHERQEATAMYRFAACLDDKDERFARSYFIATRHFHRTEDAIALLLGRFERFGSKSSLPARTLCGALEQLDRTTQVEEALARAINLRREDGELLLFAADFYGRHGRFHKATDFLDRARPRSRRASWLRAAAAIAHYQGDLSGALAHWQAVVEAEPLATDAHQTLAGLLADTAGRESALAHLRQTVDRSPQNYSLQQLLVEWLRDESPEEADAAIRRLIEIHPADAWARRELGLNLLRQHRVADAAQSAREGLALEPANPSSHFILGLALEAAGEIEAARDSYRQAIRQGVDHEAAVGALMRSANSSAEQREAVVFVYEELYRQAIFGDGLLSWQETAAGVLDPHALRFILLEALEARGDLWHAWSAAMQQSARMELFDEALRLARTATDRFPLVPRLWLDLADVQRSRRDESGEVAALEQALAINPGWSFAVRKLSEVYERNGELAQARGVLEQAASRAPRDPYNHGCLASIEWQMGDRTVAIERLERALRLHSTYDWAWWSYLKWSDELGEPERPIDFARALTAERPAEAPLWHTLGRILADRGQSADAVDAQWKAIALDGRHRDAHDELARVLALQGKFDEALAACRPPAWGEQPPFELRGRAAWVMAEQGKLPVAIEAMRSLVQESPDYFFGWARLAEWHDRAGDKEEYLQASENLVRLNGGEPVSWGYLGDARRRNGDREGATRAFERSLEIAPNYEYGGVSLIEMHLEVKEMAAAASLLDQLEKVAPTPPVITCAVRLACAKGDRTEAESRFGMLCGMRLNSMHLLAEAAGAMAGKGWARRAERAALKIVADGAADELVLPWYAIFAAERGWWGRCATNLSRLPSDVPGWRQATWRFMQFMAEAGQQRRFIRFWKRHRAALEADNYCWGTVSYGLWRLGRYRAAVRWLGDWRTRSNLEPWMLSNLNDSLRELLRFDEAHDVTRHALTTLAPDHTTEQHLLWSAVDELLSNDLSALEATLGKIDRTKLADLPLALYGLLEAALRARNALSSNKLNGAGAMGVLRRAKSTGFVLHTKNPAYSLVYHRAAMAIARKTNNRFALARHRFACWWLRKMARFTF